MKKTILFSLMSLSVQLFAQVGVNTATPSATLDITAKAATGTANTVDGVLVPRVDRERAQSMTSIPTSTMIYVNNAATGTQTGNAVNINTAGFYYFDGTAWVKMATGNGINIYNSDGTLAGVRNVNLGGNNLGFTGNGNVGVGIAVPTAKLEIASGTTGTSGLKFTNINNSTPATANASSLGVDASGNVVVQNSTPLTTAFKTFDINPSQDVATNSTVTIGTLQFRWPTNTCTASPAYLQIRSTSGANNIGVSHGMFTTSQNTPDQGFKVTGPSVIPPTFIDFTPLPMNCIQDGHAQIVFISYTDKTFYRINFQIADGDSLGFGAQGYIFVEYQK